MAYVQFNEQNISTVQVLTEQEGDGWYLIPTEHEGHSFYKLVDGKVVPFSETEVEQFNRNTFKKSYQTELKTKISLVLTETDWLIQRHSEQSSSNGETSLSDAEYSSLVEYRSNLRSLSNADLYPEEYVLPEFPLKNRYSFGSIDNLESLSSLIPN